MLATERASAPGDPVPLEVRVLAAALDAARPHLERPLLVVEGGPSRRDRRYRIDPAGFTSQDWAALAALIADKAPPFGPVEAVSPAGERLARELGRLSAMGGPLLLVDALWPSPVMHATQARRAAIGAVAVATTRPPAGVYAAFRLELPGVVDLTADRG